MNQFAIATMAAFCLSLTEAEVATIIFLKSLQSRELTDEKLSTIVMLSLLRKGLLNHQNQLTAAGELVHALILESRK